MTYMNREHLLTLADRCDRGAAELTYEAEHAAEVLATRANGDLADPQEWAERKTAAAAAARQYADGLRAEAADMAEGQRVSEERIRQAEKVATAAECGGILIDGSRLTESSIKYGWHDEAMKQALRDHQAAEDAAVEGSGLFEHVAETIDGVEQVPYWQLRGDTAGAVDGAATVADDVSAQPMQAGAEAGSDHNDDADGWEA